MSKWDERERRAQWGESTPNRITREDKIVLIRQERIPIRARRGALQMTLNSNRMITIKIIRLMPPPP